MNDLCLLEQEIEIQLKLRVPQKYHQEPIIYQLISQYQLKVTFLAAVLGKNGQGDGWFELKLTGSSEQIEQALIYLSKLNVEIWHEQDLEQSIW